jgi:HSP20 family protein
MTPLHIHTPRKEINMATLTRWEPFRSAGLPQEMERMFRDVFGTALERPTTAGAFSPLLDVEESEDGFVLHIELPGIAAEDVEITLEENVLTVSGERKFYSERDADGFRRIERSFGRFHRAVRLPDRVDADHVEANYENGLLTVTVPKAEEAKPRRIEIRGS